MALVLARVKTPEHIVGLFFANNVVIACSPLLDFMLGWDGHKVKAYVDEREWKIERVDAKFEVVRG